MKCMYGLRDRDFGLIISIFHQLSIVDLDFLQCGSAGFSHCLVSISFSLPFCSKSEASKSFSWIL